ncbi:MAG TPA: endonuclease/exonuclease/phosphatase family protein [Acetobacteraceae bacterium]|nr:endonuclease/exonuclease/phosphatase family protein [Acetobacteraceae bacterium]
MPHQPICLHAPEAAAQLPQLTAFQRSLDLNRIYVKGRVRESGNRHRLRVLSWNIERGHAPQRLAETLCVIRPDIACLQEVDWGNERTGATDVLEFLAETTGMLGLYSIEFLEIPSPLRNRRLAGGGATGNALLTRLEPSVAFRLPLPPCLDWQASDAASGLSRPARRSLQREPRIGQRFGLGAEIRVGAQRLRLCSLHLEDKQGGIAGRWAQYMAAATALDPAGEAVTCVIAGDFNTFDSRLARLLTGDNDASALGMPARMTEARWWRTALLPRTGYVDPFPNSAWTFALTPLFHVKLDWITTKGCVVGGFGVGPFSSSDHRPIWVDLYLPAA